MDYQALARKWRPRTLGEVVGQEHVIKALSNALKLSRTHHAYLFAGTRGVGKTTIARILAKALNCEAPRDFEPCGECRICRDVDEGRFTDLIEVDAASRTKVEDTRDLLENVQYAPSQGRYKVYLIDEVHMLSGHSFNALLKTLEEPPPHVKFLLATTDPHKIPITVLSRCLQFNLKRLSAEQIRTQMERILHAEEIGYDPGAVRSLARAADGSLRDGLSLLDQAIAHGGGELREAEVSTMLGTVARKPLFDLLAALADGDAEALLAHTAALAEHTANFADALQQMLHMLHHAALAQWMPEILKRDEDADQLAQLARKLRPEDLQLYYQIALLGQRDLPLATDPRSGFEMLLLRMLAFRPASWLGGEATARHLPARPTVAPPPPRDTRPAPASPPAADSMENASWPAIMQAMGLDGMTRELASHCVLQRIDQRACLLALDPRQSQLRTAQVEKRLEKALQEHFRRPLKLSIGVAAGIDETPAMQQQRQREERQRAAEQAIEQDEIVKSFKEVFDARIVPGSIQPLD